MFAGYSWSAPYRQITVGVNVEALAGKHHGGGSEFLDDCRPLDMQPGEKCGAIVDRRVVKTAVEIDLAMAAGRCVASGCKLRNGGTVDHAEPGDAEIDDLDFLLTGVIVAESPQMRVVESLDDIGDECTV